MSFNTLSLPDGAKLAYNVLGSAHIGCAEPIVLVNGASSIRGDWERLSMALAKDRPGMIDFHS
jgi:hypothetical protein